MPLSELGISGQFWPKQMVDKYVGRNLLICASAACVWDDINSFDHRGYDMMAVNDMISYLPFALDHAYSNDVKMLEHWLGARRRQYQKLDVKKIEVHTGVTARADYHAWSLPMHGTSSLNACYVALALGYDKIVLAGVPLDDSHYFFEPPWVNEAHFSKEVPDRDDGQPRYWTIAKHKIFDDRVKSLSGRTRELLGAP